MIPGLKKRAFNFHDVMLYVAIARKHLRLMILLICMACLAGTVYYIYARPVYHSRSVIHASVAMRLPVDTGTLFHDTNFINGMVSAAVTERIAKRLGIDADARQVQEKYIKKITWRRATNGNFEVDIWPYYRGLTTAWPKVMVDEYLKYRDEQRMLAREKLISTYTTEMGNLQRQMENSTERRYSFQDQTELAKARSRLVQLGELPAQIIRLQQRLAGYERVRQKLSDPKLDIIEKLSLIDSLNNQNTSLRVGKELSTQNAAPSADKEPAEGTKDTAQAPAAAVSAPVDETTILVPSMVGGATEWNRIDLERQRIRQEIQNLSAIYLPGHHKMRDLQKQLDETDRKLELEYEVAQNHIELEYRSLQGNLSDLEAKLPEYKEVSRTNEKLDRQYRLQEAGQLAWSQMYEQMAKSINTMEFGFEKERVDLEFLGVTQLHDYPVSPNRSRIFIMSIGLGLALAIAIPFLIEYLDHTISDLQEVETTFKIRGLGVVPQVEGEGESSTLFDADDEKGLVENFRLIRTNLMSLGAISKPPHVMMVTSSMPKEGKTVVSSNLALSFAQTGAKTLLIDTDLRRGRLHRLFGLRKGPGLSNLLLEKISLDQALRPTGKENLTILTAGQHLETGTELLGSEKFAVLMEEFRGKFDRIVVDTPPVLGLSETSILQKFVDGVLFVVWSGRTPIRNMKTSIEVLQANGANMYGFVLNRLDLSAKPNYYQYYYYTSDYYHNYHALENA